MRRILRLAALAGLVYAGKTAYDAWKAGNDASRRGQSGRVGYDTPTGTDPGAKWRGPGYEDKSLGQAVDQDRALVDDLVEESGGDLAEAERRFQVESAGAPALARQDEGRGPGT
jgi:hypothetical protein